MRGSPLSSGVHHGSRSLSPLFASGKFASINKASGNDFSGGWINDALINFTPGVTAVDLTLYVKADSKRESNETFEVTLSSPVGATITTSSATGTILNDDGNGAASGEDDVRNQIAVADPLWMFEPPQNLTAEQLSVPVITWIDGTPYIGDLAHDQGDDGLLDIHQDDDYDLDSGLTWSATFDAAVDLSITTIRPTQFLTSATTIVDSLGSFGLRRNGALRVAESRAADSLVMSADLDEGYETLATARLRFKAAGQLTHGHSTDAVDQVFDNWDWIDGLEGEATCAVS